MFWQSRAKCCIRLCKLLPCMHTYLTMPQHHLLNHLEVCSCAYSIGFNGGHHPSCSYISQWREQQRMSAQISWNLQSLDLGPEWLRRTEPLTYVTLQPQGTLEPTEIRTPWRTVVARQIRALATERSFFSCKFVQKPITLGLPCRSWKNELHSMILHCDLQSICIPSTVIH